MAAKQKTISVGEYAGLIGESPQVVYGRISTGKLKEGVDWIYEVTKRKRIIVKKDFPAPKTKPMPAPKKKSKKIIRKK